MERITLEHEIFYSMREDFDSAIASLLAVMTRTKRNEGSLTCKLSVELAPTNYTDPDTGEFKTVLIPQIDHKIKIAVKHDAQLSGTSCGEFEITVSNEEVRIGEYSNGQINMFNGGIPR